MNINKIEEINNIIFNVMLMFGVLGPMYLWLRTFENKNKIIRVVTFIIYFGIECIWFMYLWFVWFPVTVIAILLLVAIDIKYGNRIKHLVVEKR